MARRLPPMQEEDGFTLIEMLVAMTMGVVVMGGVVILLIGAMRSQPRLDKQATNVQTARYALERMTRELRNGVLVTENKYTSSSISFETYVRHTTCGGSTMSASSAGATKCEVTYTCSGSSCTRIEAAPGVTTGTAVPILTGIGNASSVFAYPQATRPPTYVEVTLKIPDPEGSGALTISDGASLRNATLTN